MGFGCGVEAVKKCNMGTKSDPKNCTIEDYFNTSKYLFWRDAPWRDKSSSEEYEKKPSEELIDFYSKNGDIKLFESGPYTLDVNRFDKYMMDYLTGVVSETGRFEITKDDVKLINDYINGLKYLDVKEANINQSIQIRNEDDDRVEVLRDIDGVVVDVLGDDNWSMEKVYNEDNNNLFYVEDALGYYFLRRLESLSDKLSVIDFENYFVYYWRG